MDARKLYEQADHLFTKRAALLSLWQELADNFYPERADFIAKRSLGTDFASNLSTSYPVMARRDLGNAFSTMLRPASKPWFNIGIRNREEDDLSQEAKAWLEKATTLQRRAMYDRSSLFARATTEADHDFACFGQCVLSVELNNQANGLLYRCWHLRDMAWQENAEGKIAYIFRKWKPTLRELVSLFPGERLHKSILDRVSREPFEEVEIMHMVVESDITDDGTSAPWVSIYYDVEHHQVIEETGVLNPIYVIPRWQTVSGSQYAYSPATVAALPDARLLQAMTYTLLEAGEKYNNPPLLAVQEAIRSDISLYAGGVTWVDAAYDERLGEVLRPLTQDMRGMPLGMELTQDVRNQLVSAFYLNKLTLPQRTPEMTAYEVGQRIQQYIREALPLFAPMEDEYNGQLCERTFDLLLQAGAFGPMQNLPVDLQGAEVQFRFESPLHEAIEREKGNRFMEAQSLSVSAAQLDPSAAALLDVRKALRDVLRGMQVPTKWTRPEQEVEQMQEQRLKMQQAEQALALTQQSAETAAAVAEAEKAREGVT